MKSIHDPPYYRKMHASDTKAVEVLQGRGPKRKKAFKIPRATKKKRKRKKGMKSYIKSGAPYNLNPPKRRSASKLSAPPGAVPMASMEETDILQEEGGPITFDQMIDLAKTGDKLSLTFRKKVEGDKFGQVVFKKGKTYAGSVQSDGISISHENIVTGLAGYSTQSVLSKEDLKKKIRAAGDPCASIDCSISTITSPGQPPVKISAIMAPTARKQRRRALQHTPRAPEGGPSVRLKTRKAPGQIGQIPLKYGHPNILGRVIKDLGTALKAGGLGALKTIGGKPLVTATPLLGVGVQFDCKEAIGVNCIVDIDSTGPGMGIGVRPQVFAAWLRKAGEKLPAEQKNEINHYAKQIAALNVPQIYVGVELHGALPLPFVGAGATPKDAHKIKEIMQKFLGVAVNDKEAESFMEWAGLDEAEEMTTAIMSWLEEAGLPVDSEEAKGLIKDILAEVPIGGQVIIAEFYILIKYLFSILATAGWDKIEKVKDVAVNKLKKCNTECAGVAGAKKIKCVAACKARDLKKFNKKIGATSAGGKAFIFGDSQITNSLGAGFQRKLGVSSQERIGVPNKGIDYFLKGDGYNRIIEKIKSQAPNLIAIALGGNGKVGDNRPQQLINKILEAHPNPNKVKIIWVGPPPILKRVGGKYVPSVMAKAPVHGGVDKWNNRRKAKNISIGKNLKEYPNVSFIDAYDLAKEVGYVDEAPKIRQGWHVGPVYAEKMVDKILRGVAAVPSGAEIKPTTVISGGVVETIQINLTNRQRRNATIIENIFTEAGYSKNVIAAAISNAANESALNQYTIGDGGSAAGLFQLARGCGAGKGYHGLDCAITGETKKEFRKLCEDNNINPGDWRASRNLRKLGKLAPFGESRLAAGDPRFDPIINTRKILKDSGMKAVKADDRAAASIQKLTEVFLTEVERSGIPHLQKRLDWSARAWPGVTRFD